MIQTRNLTITDEEFINKFLHFNFAAKAAINHLLCEKLYNDNKIGNEDVKAIIIQILENYYHITEMALMLLIAFHKKKDEPTISLLSHYHSVFVREKKEITNKQLSIIVESDKNNFCEYFGFKTTEQLLKHYSEEANNELEEMFGSIDKAIEQADRELTNLKGSLEMILSNRIQTPDGEPFPFYKILNKIKHGYQVVEDEEEDELNILLEVVSKTTESTEFEIISIKVEKENAYFFAEQSKLISLSIQHLLRYYILSQ